MNWPLVLPGLVTGSAIVLGLWLLFRIFPRIAPDIRAWCWRLAILKLAISAFAIGQVTLYLLPNIQPAQPPQVVKNFAPAPEHFIETERPKNYEPVAIAAPAAVAFHSAAKPAQQNSAMYLLALWGLGFAIFSFRALLGSIRTRRILRHAAPVTDPEIIGCLEILSNGAGLRRTPRIVTLDTTQSPMVYGIWRSIIVLPKRLACGASDEIELALGHEVAHLRRRDLAWATVAWLVRSLLFFNPVAWLAESELRATQESATDQETVWLTRASITVYGKMLLHAMSPERMASRHSGLAMFDSFANAQRRLCAMKHFTDRPRSTRRVAVAALVTVGIGFLPTYLIAPAYAASHKQGQQTTRHISAYDEVSPSISSPENKAHELQVAAVTSGINAGITPRPSSLEPTATPKLNSQTPTDHATDIKFTEDRPAAVQTDVPESPELKQAIKRTQDEFDGQVNTLIQDQDRRISEYRVGADQREREAEQREREAQQRKREGEQRARAALLREQVIEANERDNYQSVEPGQRERDAQTRREDKRRYDADQYQLVLDQKQRETDQWQRDFDANSIEAMKKETEQAIAAARSQMHQRITELMAEDAKRQHESSSAAASSLANIKAESNLHYVRAASGLSFAIPNGYQVEQVRAEGKGSYTLVLSRNKS